LISSAVAGPITVKRRLSGVLDSDEERGMAPPIISALSWGNNGFLSGNLASKSVFSSSVSWIFLVLVAML